MDTVRHSIVALLLAYLFGSQLKIHTPDGFVLLEIRLGWDSLLPDCLP